MPVTGEKIECGDWVFEVVDLDGKRIDKILAVPQPQVLPETTATPS
jgi:putative hemolysin